jgi:hypothetical protein
MCSSEMMEQTELTQCKNSKFVYKGLSPWKIVFWVFPRRLSIKSRRFGTLCRFHLQQVVKCEWGQAGNCLYLYGKRVVGERWFGPIRGEGRGQSSGSQEGPHARTLARTHTHTHTHTHSGKWLEERQHLNSLKMRCLVDDLYIYPQPIWPSFS